MAETTYASRIDPLIQAGLRKHVNNPTAAARFAADAIQNDLTAIKELCGSELREMIERRLGFRARQLAQLPSGKAQTRNEASQSTGALKSRPASASASFHEPIWTEMDIVPPVREDREEAGRGRIADGLGRSAQPPRETKSTNDGERGQSSGANGLCRPAPLPSPKTAGNGHRAFAESHGSSAVSSGLRFSPGHARRGASVIASVQATMAKSLLDTFKVRDGRVIGDLMLKDLPSLVAANQKEAAILDRIRNHTANGGPSQLVREIISAESLERFVAEAEEVSRAA